MSSKIKPSKVEKTDGKGEVDFKKEYTNGHKFFGAQESQAFVELLCTEKKTNERFHKMKDKMRYPRNPLNGDYTPRDESGDRVTNPSNFEKIAEGVLLFDPDRPPLQREISPRLVDRNNIKYEKIGVPDAKYLIMGNTGSISKEANKYDAVSLKARKKENEMEERKKINEQIILQKAKREKERLSREINILQKQQAQKEKEINYLKSTYQIS